MDKSYDKCEVLTFTGDMHRGKYVHCGTIFLDFFNQVHILLPRSNVSIPVSEEKV